MDYKVKMDCRAVLGHKAGLVVRVDLAVKASVVSKARKAAAQWANKERLVNKVNLAVRADAVNKALKVAAPWESRAN